MNKLTKIFAGCFIACILLSCDKDEKVTEDTTPYFGVAGNDLTQAFVGESETRYVTVSTNRDFTANSSDPSWCTVEIIKDKVDNLKIVVTQNGKAEERTAQITVSSAGFDDVTITVTQSWIPSIVPDKPYVLLNNDNLEFTLKITGNIAYELELPDWISERIRQEDGTHVFGFSAIAPGERAGNITIKAAAENSGTRVVVPVVQRERIKKIGSWLFEDPQNLTKATEGKELQMVRNVDYDPDAHFLPVDGPSSNNKAVRIPVNCHFLADHGMIPKEGENYISEYTLFFEFKIPVVGRFYSFFQTNLSNTGDAEIFVRNSNPPTIGVGATGYAGAGLIEADKWHRLYLSFKPGDVRFFIDGQQFHTSGTSDSRFRIDLNGIILCGGPWAKKDDNEFDIAELSIWNGALSLDDIRELEGVE
ncbi:BACON domain-containing protein [Proteiniphilum sp. X52]|uniref:BACON domain-containing protein n=1 Tax=Proteiniphilum sp. X52 TaxID=2382159 RepID=UPI000F0A62B2|nr:BACON domain-containing carbohydrate-binding protein [Proteiniphilum sp. X52]RNC65750.1 hypothetical protein D7D25_06305 [Proteiniphilum sp. X52]